MGVVWIASPVKEMALKARPLPLGVVNLECA